MNALSLDAQQANLLVSVFLPLVVGLVTKQVTNPDVKRIVLAVLSAVTGTLTTVVEQGLDDVMVTNVLVGILISVATAQAAYTNVLQPLGVAGLVQRLSDRYGIGATIQPASATTDPSTIAPETEPEPEAPAEPPKKRRAPRKKAAGAPVQRD